MMQDGHVRLRNHRRIHRIRKAYLPVVSAISVVTAAIFEESAGRTFTAFFLYDVRNISKNSDFYNGLSC
ncbi:hypothetical protein [Bacillus cereus]|uniref:hypothetical protein n=1 Tax=Bacillus cereus TaxID=1396 RepID=UPI003D9685FF